MPVRDLNKVAVNMAKVIRSLAKLKSMIYGAHDIIEHREEFLMLAYVCRVGILDRIENNSWMRMNSSIRIPTGLFLYRKETIAIGLTLTVDKLIEMVELDDLTAGHVEQILVRGELFYVFKGVIPHNIQRKL